MLSLFANTHNREGNNPSVVTVKLARQIGVHPWERRAPIPLNKRWTRQQISPGLEITETQHRCPPVGLFVRLREGQSAAADRCVCSWFRRGSRGEVRHRFLCCVSLEGRQASSQDVQAWPFLTLQLLLYNTWTKMIRRWSSSNLKQNIKLKWKICAHKTSHTDLLPKLAGWRHAI